MIDVSLFLINIWQSNLISPIFWCNFKNFLSKKVSAVFVQYSFFLLHLLIFCTFLVSKHYQIHHGTIVLFWSLITLIQHTYFILLLVVFIQLSSSDTEVIVVFYYIQMKEERQWWMGDNNLVKPYRDSLEEKYLSSKNKTRIYWRLLCYRWC